MRPTSRSAAASSFWRGYAASLRRSWLGRMVPGGHGGRHAQDVRPVPVDQFHVHLAADQRAQAPRDARAFEHVEVLRRQVPDARNERVAEGRARGEDMVGEAAGVGVLFADAPPGLVHQEPVEDVGRFVDGSRDGLGGKRRVPVGDVRVRLDAGSAPYRRYLYSARSRCAGFVRSARTVGTVTAAAAITSKRNAACMRTTGSLGDVSKRTPPSQRLATTTSTNPATSPPATAVTVSPTAAATTCVHRAPSASRMAISIRRNAKEAAVLQPHALAEGVLEGPEMTRQRSVDDSHKGPAGPILFVEVTASKRTGADRRKEPRAHRAPVCRLLPGRPQLGATAVVRPRGRPSAGPVRRSSREHDPFDVRMPPLRLRLLRGRVRLAAGGLQRYLASPHRRTVQRLNAGRSPRPTRTRETRPGTRGASRAR